MGAVARSTAVLITWTPHIRATLCGPSRISVRGGLCRGAAGGRHPGSTKRTPFTGRPRNRSWRPLEDSVGVRNNGVVGIHSRGGDRGVRDGRAKSGGEDNAPPNSTHRSSKRVPCCEAWCSPASFASDGPEPAGASLVRLRTGERAVRKEDTSRMDEHEPKGSGRVRTPQELAARPRSNGGAQRWETAKLRVLESKCFGVQKSVGRILPATPRAHSRPENERTNSATHLRCGDATKGWVTSSDSGARVGITVPCRIEIPAHRGMRKPRRDRTRRGAGSETREVSGPRACSNRYDGRVSGPRCRLSNPEATPATLASKVNAKARLGAPTPADRAGRNRAHRCPRSDKDIRRSGRFRWLSQPRSSSRRCGAEGRHPRRDAPLCGACAVDVKPVAFAPQVLRGRREPGGVRRAACSWIDSVDVGDG